jgi:hypothetical protein
LIPFRLMLHLHQRYVWKGKKSRVLVRNKFVRKTGLKDLATDSFVDFIRIFVIESFKSFEFEGGHDAKRMSALLQRGSRLAVPLGR